MNSTQKANETFEKIRKEYFSNSKGDFRIIKGQYCGKGYNVV